MTLEFIEDMITRFKNGKKIHKKYAYQIVMKAKEIFYAEPTMPEASIAEGNRLTVCGDTHGIFLFRTAESLVACTGFNLKQVNTSIFSKYLIVMVIRQKHMPTFSMEISLTVDPGLPRLRSFSSRTNGYTLKTSS